MILRIEFFASANVLVLGLNMENSTELSANTLFNVNGIVAVITGGGSGSLLGIMTTESGA